MHKITALARPVDPRYPTNLAIAVLSLVVVLAAAAWRWSTGAAPLGSILWGINAGLVPFLTWALGRELDPDHDLSAFVGAALALVALFFVEFPSLFAMVWLLLLLRVVNRTVGLPATLFDTLTVLGLGIWLTWQGEWMAGLATALALLLDGLLPPALRRHLIAAVLALGGTVVILVVHGAAPEGFSSLEMGIPALVTAVLFLVVIVMSRRVQALGDVTGEPLRVERVQAAQGLALLTAVLYGVWSGSAGVLALLPLWAAMAGGGIYALAYALFRHDS
jgi:hypothetical protein